jgi:hypothetical protein
MRLKLRHVLVGGVLLAVCGGGVAIVVLHADSGGTGDGNTQPIDDNHRYPTRDYRDIGGHH